MTFGNSQARHQTAGTVPLSCTGQARPAVRGWEQSACRCAVGTHPPCFCNTTNRDSLVPNYEIFLNAPCPRQLVSVSYGRVAEPLHKHARLRPAQPLPVSGVLFSVGGAEILTSTYLVWLVGPGFAPDASEMSLVRSDPTSLQAPVCAASRQIRATRSWSRAARGARVLGAGTAPPRLLQPPLHPLSLTPAPAPRLETQLADAAPLTLASLLLFGAPLSCRCRSPSLLPSAAHVPCLVREPESIAPPSSSRPPPKACSGEHSAAQRASPSMAQPPTKRKVSG